MPGQTDLRLARRHPQMRSINRFGQAAGVMACCLAASCARSPARSPAPYSPPRAPFRFVVYGDCRTGVDVHRKLVSGIVKATPDLIFQTGDLVPIGTDTDAWKEYDQITAPLAAVAPIYPARGNHDLGGPDYEARVTAPFTSGNKLYYSLDRAGCHFVILDNFSPLDPGSNQYVWLTHDLENRAKKGTPTFVFFHEPPYSIGAHGSNMEVRQTLCPMFEKHHVSAVFCGHDHIYYRTTRSGVLYVVTGGGGAPLYECDPKKGTIKGDKWESVHHFVICDVKGTSLRLTAIREDGSLLDKLTLTLRPSV